VVADATLGGTIVEEHRVTTTTLVPALLQRSAPGALRRPRCRYPRCAWSKDRFPGVDFVQTYGQTEASPRATAVPRGLGRRLPGSVGIPIPGVSLSIHDGSGHPVPAGQVGQIVVRGHLMLGYHRRPDETAAVLRDGALRTGDLGSTRPPDSCTLPAG
jgi:non-ribosomal peptide synthetase component F